MTQPMTPERLAEVRGIVTTESWQQNDTIDDDIKQEMATELLAEIDRLNKYYSAQVDMAYHYVREIDRLQTQLKSARDVLRHYAIKETQITERDFPAFDWIKENPE